jgi:hypothetical protein
VRSRVALVGLALVVILVALPAGAAARLARSAPATKLVTVRLSGSGVGTWSVDSPNDRGQSALKYSWSGTLKFKVPTRVLKSPTTAKKLNVPGRATLVASWNGVLTGEKLSGFAAGPYRCEYHGHGVRAPVSASLTRGPKRTFNLTLHPRGQEEFFAAKSDNSTVNCTTAYGENGPPHFGPNWLFRDTTSFRSGNRYYMTSNTAIISVPSKLLPRGTEKIAFPREVGSRNSPFVGKITWKNLGKLVVRAR